MKQVDLYGEEPDPKRHKKMTYQEKILQRMKDGKCWKCCASLDLKGSSLCSKCMKKKDPKKYARILAYNKYGTARKCSECEAVTNVEWHHEDYSKPLEVVPLCKICHGKRRSNPL